MPASAQAPAPAIVADGNAVVTGFSGIQLPTMIAPGADPAAKASIDLNGPVLRVIDLQAPGAPPQGQVLIAPKLFTATAGQIGQVFGIALDRANPPNIYVAATSVYGLPIVVPDADKDGAPDRAEQGTANASFMPGLFGPAAQGGGPGSIWRIDGATGAVSLFANVMHDGAANSGPALGGLAFDPAGNALLVADRETGMIHRFDMAGAETGRYDHGTQGRPAAGLAAVAFDPSKRLSVTVPAFQPANPGTWGYAPPARRVFGLAVRDGRLYYAVAENLQIWSVAVAPDGSFGNDARIDVTVPPGQGTSEISQIAFDDQGRMLLAERVAASGAFDFTALTVAGGGRVLRFDPSGGGGPLWQPAAGDPAAGLDPTLHGNGGIAVGFGYDAAGRRDPAVCGGSVWWTGEELASGGAQAVNGIAGRPDGATAVWLIDFDDRLDDPEIRGWLGAVVVLRTCPAAVAAGPPPGVPPPGPGVTPPYPPPYPPEPVPGPDVVVGPGPDGFGPDFGPDDEPPPPLCPVGTHIENNGLQCCQAGFIPGPTGTCVSPCANGDSTVAGMEACMNGFFPPNNPAWTASTGTCLDGSAPVQVTAVPCATTDYTCWKCPKSPMKPPCEPGTVEMVASATQPVMPHWRWSDRTCADLPTLPPCPAGMQYGLDLTCRALCPNPGERAWPVRQCCDDGTSPDANGQCNPGFFVPPDWYLDWAASGTGPCDPALNCSYYEFTVTGRQRFGRGVLRQRITLPAGAAMSDVRITKAARHCPASAWSCSQAGDVVTCSAANCGLAPGDQVVLRIEGQVAPGVTTAPPTPAERTACGTLEWQAAAGSGPAATIPANDPRVTMARLQRAARPPSATPPPAAQPAGGTLKQACWTIWLVGRTTPAGCRPGYVATADGQCCLSRQITAAGVCCPPGQRPDPTRASCIGVCPPGTVEVRGRCVTPVTPVHPVTPVDPEVDTITCPQGYAPSRDRHCCLRRQMTVDGVCCPPGQRPDAKRRTCAPVCPEGRVWTGSGCGCPPGTVERRGRCVLPPPIPPVPPPPSCGPDRTGVWPNCCPIGLHWNGRRCVPTEGGTCPPDSIGTDPNCRCRPPLVGTPGHCKRPVCDPDRGGVWPNCCPAGQVWNGRRCVPREGGACPPDSVGKYPDCRCRPPLVGTPGHCTRAICPRDSVGEYPNCRCRPPLVGTPGSCARPCPPGTTGTPPNCRPLLRPCPEGTVGRPPNCRPIRCPEGTAGRPPNCKPIRCPEGTTGRPPNCRPITCPEGTSLRRGRCVPVSRPPGGTSPQIQPLQPGTLQIRPVPR